MNEIRMSAGLRRFLCGALFTAALMASVAFSASAAQKNGAADMPLLDESGRHLQEFQKTKVPARFRQALLELIAVEAPRQAGAERDKVTGAWFALLRTLDSALDPAFDSKDLPQLHVVPPTVNGVTYPAGVDPAVITDPVARAQYQAAVNENTAKSRRFATGYALHDLDTRAMDAFRAYHRRAYPPTNADAADFDRLLSKSGLTAARKKFMR